MVRLFADTYALIELLKGNPNYEGYSDVELVSTEFNILELAYALFRDFGPDEAAKIMKSVRAKIDVMLTDDIDYRMRPGSDCLKIGPERSFPWWMHSVILIPESWV